MQLLGLGWTYKGNPVIEIRRDGVIVLERRDRRKYQTFIEKEEIEKNVNKCSKNG